CPASRRKSASKTEVPSCSLTGSAAARRKAGASCATPPSTVFSTVIFPLLLLCASGHGLRPATMAVDVSSGGSRPPEYHRGNHQPDDRPDQGATPGEDVGVTAVKGHRDN